MIRNTNPNSQYWYQRRPSKTEYSSRRWLLDSFHSITFCECFLSWPMFKNSHHKRKQPSWPACTKTTWQIKTSCSEQPPTQICYKNHTSSQTQEVHVDTVIPFVGFFPLPLTKVTKCNSTMKGEMDMVPSHQIFTNACLQQHVSL